MSDAYFADLYNWLQEAYESALHLAQPQLAMQYAAHMRAMETAGLVVVADKPTLH